MAIPLDRRVRGPRGAIIVGRVSHQIAVHRRRPRHGRDVRRAGRDRPRAGRGPGQTSNAWPCSRIATGSPATCTTTSSSACSPPDSACRACAATHRRPVHPRSDSAETVDDLDDTIRQIRNDHLRPAGRRRNALRCGAAVLAVVAELSPAAGFPTGRRLVRSGRHCRRRHRGRRHRSGHPREASPTSPGTRRPRQFGWPSPSDARPARRRQSIDDGVGIGDSTRRSGLANLTRRAERRGGTLDGRPRPEGGLRRPMDDTPIAETTDRSASSSSTTTRWSGAV